MNMTPKLVRKPVKLSPEFEKSLSDLSHLADTLNAHTDDLTASVAAIDAYLDRIKLGVRCRIYGPAPEAGKPQFVYAYMRMESGWGLCVASEMPGTAPKIWAFAHAPRHMRIAMVKELPRLLTELEHAATAQVARVSEAVVVAREIAGAMKTEV